MEERSPIYCDFYLPRHLETVCYRSLFTQVMLMEMYGSRKAQSNFNQSYYGPISKPTSTQVPFLLPDLDDQTVQIHDAKIQQNKKKQLTTSLINSLTILNLQPQRLPCQQPNMHSREEGMTTRASV